MDENPYNPTAPYRFEFTFGFYDDAIDDYNWQVKYFLFLIPDEETLQKVRWIDDHTHEHMWFLEDMCEYGDHDINMDNDTVLDGYSSTEVEEDKADELMGKWREWYVGQGFECGPVITMSETDYREKFPQED